jgi:hypothetical protein
MQLIAVIYMMNFGQAISLIKRNKIFRLRAAYYLLVFLSVDPVYSPTAYDIFVPHKNDPFMYFIFRSVFFLSSIPEKPTESLS